MVRDDDYSQAVLTVMAGSPEYSTLMAPQKQPPEGMLSVLCGRSWVNKRVLGESRCLFRICF